MLMHKFKKVVSENYFLTQHFPNEQYRYSTCKKLTILPTHRPF